MWFAIGSSDFQNHCMFLNSRLLTLNLINDAPGSQCGFSALLDDESNHINAL